jgi:uncharacterized protein with ATP-grasp and redox domains
MKTSLDCIPCFIRQALEAARMVTQNPVVHEQIVRDVLGMVSRMDLAEPPVVIGQRVHRRLREISGQDDPYRTAKDTFNRAALDMLPELAEMVHRAPDSLAMAARLAIAGNVVDLGANGGLTVSDMRRVLRQVLSEPFAADTNKFRDAVDQAKSVLYLADNAGELVFDRLLIEELRGRDTALAVRGGPVINDATRVDANAAGIDELCEVIDNGSDAPGTRLDDCSEEFCRRFREADLIIAKGQGNYETLSDEPANVIFLLKVKCAVIASHIGMPEGTQVLRQSHSAPSGAGGNDHARI